MLDRSARHFRQHPREIYYRFDGRQLGQVHNDGTGNVDYATTIVRRGEEVSTTAFERNGGGQVFADFKQSFDRTNSYSQIAFQPMEN